MLDDPARDLSVKPEEGLIRDTPPPTDETAKSIDTLSPTTDEDNAPDVDIPLS